MQLFVYGTLKGATRTTRAKQTIEDVSVGGTMYHLGGFPGVVFGGMDDVVGEIHQIDDEDAENVLSKLDSYEGYTPNAPQYSLYIRKEIDTPEGKAWSYEWNGDLENPVIESGVWEQEYEI